MDSDRILLQRYAASRDAGAYAVLVSRYGRLVYGTCLRIVGNPADAEDVAQECFLELARSAGGVSGSLPGWLHALARHRAVDAMRAGDRRRRREREVALQRSEK